GDGKNDGFYLLGPDFALSSDNAAVPPGQTLKLKDQVINGNRSSMTYEIDKTQALDEDPDTKQLPSFSHTILLRRLACPYRPYDSKAVIPDPNDPTMTMMIPNPNYNPFVTVDYLDNVPTWNGIKYGPAGANGNAK